MKQRKPRCHGYDVTLEGVCAFHRDQALPAERVRAVIYCPSPGWGAAAGMDKQGSSTLSLPPTRTPLCTPLCNDGGATHA